MSIREIYDEKARNAVERAKSLPDKAADLLALALDNMAALDREFYVPDSEVYFGPRGADGLVPLDLVGAVMVVTLEFIISPPFMAANVRTANKLSAIESLACGDIVSAVVFSGSEQVYDAMSKPYKSERDELYESLTWPQTKIVDAWEAIGEAALAYKGWDAYFGVEPRLRELVWNMRREGF